MYLRKLARLLCIGFVLACAAAGCSDKSDCPPVRPAPAASAVRADASWPNVLLISIDTLRRDHLSCYGYARQTTPNIDRLAAEGAMFEQMISSSSWTLPAHAAMFSGLSDSVHGAIDTDRRLADSRYTLAERLRDAGYATAGFFSGPTLYPAFGLGQGFETYVDCTSYGQLSYESVQSGGKIEVGGALQQAAIQDVTSPRLHEGVTNWLHENTRRPFFLFVHMWDPHFDFIPPPPYDTLFDPDYQGPASGRNFVWDDRVNPLMPRRDLEHIIALYDGEIAWTDYHVGRILAELDALKLKDSTLVVVLSDHGTEFFEHNGKGHRQTLFDECIRVPLVLRWPGRISAGRRIAAQARMIDVLPTICDLIGLGSPSDVMGQTLAPALTGAKLAQDNLAVCSLYSLGRKLRAYRRPGRKMLFDERANGGVVYNLRDDPGEQRPLRDLTAPLVQLATRDARTALRWLGEFQKRFPVEAAAPKLDERVLRQLRSFGYIGGGKNQEQPAKP